MANPYKIDTYVNARCLQHCLIGLTRKVAADEIGISYKLMRRLVSAGISRTDQRNLESLTKIAAYFALRTADAFWHPDLMQLVLAADTSFVKKFRARLLAERERRFAASAASMHDELSLLSKALGFETASAPLTGPYADKVAVILRSPRAAQFRRLIDDYHARHGLPRELGEGFVS